MNCRLLAPSFRALVVTLGVASLCALGILLLYAVPAHADEQCPPGTVPKEIWDRLHHRMVIVCVAPSSTATPVPPTPTSLPPGNRTPGPTSVPTRPPVPTATPTPDPSLTPPPGTPPPVRPTWVPPDWQWMGCAQGPTCPVDQGHSCWGNPNRGTEMCSLTCDCGLGPAATPTPSGPTPPPHGGSLPDPRPPGFDGFWKQVQAQVGTPIARYHPYPSGLVNTDTAFWVDDATPLFAPSEAGSTLTIGAWADPQGDHSVTWRNYRLSLHWRLRTDAPFAWDPADGSPIEIGGFGQAGAVHHTYQRSSYGQPQDGPHDPNTAQTYPGQTPAFPVTVATFWTAEWRVEYDEDRVVDDSHCVAPGSPGATDHSDRCPGDGPNHHSGTRHEISHHGPTPWQEIDLRQLGNPISDAQQATTLPTSIVQIQSILTR